MKKLILSISFLACLFLTTALQAQNTEISIQDLSFDFLTDKGMSVKPHETIKCLVYIGDNEHDITSKRGEFEQPNPSNTSHSTIVLTSSTGVLFSTSGASSSSSLVLGNTFSDTGLLYIKFVVYSGSYQDSDIRRATIQYNIENHQHSPFWYE